MAFSNPITGGQGTLVRPAIKSPDYSPGVSGWTINRDGSAEFNNLTIRGTFNGTDFILNTDGFFLYSGTPAAGNLVASAASVDGTDDFGNAYLAGFTTYGTDINSQPITSQLLNGEVNLFPPNVAGVDPGGMTVTSLSPSTVYRLTLQPPALLAAGLGWPLIEMYTESAVGAADVEMQLFSDNISLFPNVGWNINGVQQGFGVMSFIARQTSTAAITTTETVALTAPGFGFGKNRAYRINVHGIATSTVAGDTVTVRVRKTNTTGTLLLDTGQSIGIPAASAMCTFDNSVVVITNASPPIASLVATFLRGAGTGNVQITASATIPAYLEIVDIGAASDYANARLLT
jgi:hypothetical protein